MEIIYLFIGYSIAVFIPLAYILYRAAKDTLVYDKSHIVTPQELDIHLVEKKIPEDYKQLSVA